MTGCQSVDADARGQIRGLCHHQLNYVLRVPISSDVLELIRPNTGPGSLRLCFSDPAFRHAWYLFPAFREARARMILYVPIPASRLSCALMFVFKLSVHYFPTLSSLRQCFRSSLVVFYGGGCVHNDPIRDSVQDSDNYLHGAHEHGGHNNVRALVV